MYIPNAFREDDIEKLVAFMRANSFATLVSILNDVPVASHIPLVVTVQNNVVKLSGHVAKPNPQWQVFGVGEALAVFTGPHAYISPSLYEKQESVPTWNYIAVHAYGVPQVITLGDSPELMDKMIEDMIDTYGSEYKSQWHSLSDNFREGMMNGIIGFEMTITRLEGKYKLSQNRSHSDQNNVAHALLQSTDPTVHGIGAAMKQNLETGEHLPE
ncbi:MULTISPECIES: FMN-binding negative transcriptional regulator [unclassified Nostoc]|uniref:FMN-binding negative transcriptional regulator n=1 Tax=unclassified Nostoc TaxID=2593658 RepID=UPI0025AAEF40|nr:MULTISPECIES: FMN-binding negative transcriptional regulator [unclassified Nostoc]MDM9583244.1 FMN-binding negative transcriptional regulator [Nostoc sp. GT001]MDZ7943583.1 FMN-binding negative transcriptional regulator [Nostoc sp. EfeVER01]MDZ7992704.1 FMN-binding negative transcriptional regulator [Nostoc sp. EspVER01]